MASSYLTPPSNRRRATAIGLTVLIHLALIWALLNLGPRIERRDFGNALQTFDVAGSAPAVAPRAAPQPRPAERPREVTRATPAPPPPVVYKEAPNVIWMTKDQFAANDLSRLRRTDADRSEAVAEAGGAGTGRGDSAAAYGPGEGPGGERLYAAEWYREPTTAELRTFLPPAPPDSWGMIACRTVAEFRVENCRTLGDSPLGSGIATGMRRAAWQFRVRPPRIGGKPQYGTWVRIRIDFTQIGPEVR